MDRRRYFKYVGAIVVGVGLAAAGFHVWRVSAPPKPLQLYKGFEFLSSTLEKYYLARLKGFKESFDEAQPARGIIYSVSRDHWYLMNFPPFAGWRGALEAWFHVKRRFKTSNIRLKGWLHVGFPGQLYYRIVYLSSGSPLDQGGMHVVDREDVDVAASWDWISGDQKYPFFHVTDSVSIDANIEYVVVCIMDRDGSRRSEVWINELWI